MQAAGPAAPKRRLRQRARLLVQGIDTASAAGQAETGFDAGRVAPRVQANRQGAVIFGRFKFLVARHLLPQVRCSSSCLLRPKADVPPCPIDIRT